METLASGGDWSKDAAYAAANAADAAAYAARIRQRDSLLEIIKQAPLGDQA